MDSTATSSIISALGGGSGVDMAKLAGDLAIARFQPQVTQLEARSEALEAKISAASTLKNQMSQLASALGDRVRNGDLAPSASIGNGAVAKVSVLAGSLAQGTYALEVGQLASAQTLASNTYAAATDLAGEGQLTIRTGTIDGAVFTPGGTQDPLVIDVLATDTLEDVAAKIRAAGSGITAYVANTGSGAKLVVKGQDGAANAFVIEASGPSAAGSPAPGAIDYLAWNPATDSGQIKAYSADAQYMFDGVAMSSASNTISDLPGGLVLTLTGTNQGAPTQIGYDAKNEQITSMMGDFAAALNDVAASLAELAAPLGGDLGNDPGARALKRALASLSTQIVMPSAAAGAPSTLADLGLVFNRDGTFRIDETRLQKTLAEDLPAASAMFTTGLFGLYASMDKMARNLTSLTDPGSLGGSVERYTSQLEQMDERLAKIALQQEALREQMVKTFTWADRSVASSQSTLNFLKGQIAAWNAQDS